MMHEEYVIALKPNQLQGYLSTGEYYHLTQHRDL